MDLAAALPADARFEPVDGATYAHTVGQLRGSPAAQQQAHAERLAASPVPYQGCVLRRGGEVLACGQFAREGRLVGLYDIFTAARGPQPGPVTRRVRRLLRQAAAEGPAPPTCRSTRPMRRRWPSTSAWDSAIGYRYHYRAPKSALA
jgi:hypothetical protein